MKKTLVAIAALAAVSAFAQSSVTVYGIVDQAFQTNKQNNRAGTEYQNYTGLSGGAMAGSRIGFRGTEDLGGGSKAEFVLEQGIEPSQAQGYNYRLTGDGVGTPQNSTTGGNRQSFLSLSNTTLGSIKAGRIYASTYDMYTNNGFIVAEAAGNGQATWGADTRVKGVSYLTPTMNGFTLGLWYAGLGEEGNNVDATYGSTNGFSNRKAQYNAYRAMWAQGPARIGYSFEQAKMSGTADSTNIKAETGKITNAYGVVVADAADINNAYTLKTSTLVGAYKFDKFELIGIYGKADRGNAKDTTNSQEKFNQITAKVPFGGAWEAQFNYYTKKLTKDTTGVASSDLKGNYLNVNYSFSKRTRAYVAMGTQKDSAGLDTAQAVQQIKRNLVGVIHTF